MKQRYTCTRMMGEWKSMEKERDTTLSVKRGGGSVMAWLCMADGGTRSLVLTDDEAEGWILKWLYPLIIFSRMLLNWSDRSNLKVKKWYILQWPDQSPDLKPTEHAFELLNTKLNVETPIQAVTECEGSLGLEEHISIWWCPCVLDFRQSVTTKVFHASTKKNPYS